MVSIIMGLKGTGKTKTLIDLVNTKAAEDHGSVVCIEKDQKLRYDITHRARLISAAEYKIVDYKSFYGFICGIVAGNFDITDIFIDSVTKICGMNDDMNDLAAFIDSLDHLTSDINITMTVSHDENDAPEILKKHLVFTDRH